MSHLPQILISLHDRSGYVAIQGETEHNEETIRYFQNHGQTLARMVSEGNQHQWIVDLSRFTGGSDAVSCMLLECLFIDPVLGYMVGRNWINPIQLSDKTGHSLPKDRPGHKYQGKVIILISQETSSAGEFTTAFLKRSRKSSSQPCTITSMDGAGRTNGRLSINASDSIDDIAFPACPTAYYVSEIHGDIKHVQNIVWNNDSKRRSFVGLNHTRKVVVRPVKPLLPYVTCDNHI